MAALLYLHMDYTGLVSLSNFMTKILLFIICFLALSCSSRDRDNKQESEAIPEAAVAPIKNERPVMNLTLTDGRQIDAQTMNEQMVLVLFQPDCDHCQREATQIKKRLEAFRDYKIYFISSHPMEIIQKFATDYKLDNEPNVFFGYTTVENVLNNYGAISAPSIYIYTKEGRLVESFDGLVDVEVIIKYL